MIGRKSLNKAFKVLIAGTHANIKDIGLAYRI